MKDKFRIIMYIIAVILLGCLYQNCYSKRNEAALSGNFDIENFLENPFPNKEMFPLFFENYESLREYFGKDFKIEEKDIRNRHDNSKIDKRIILTTNKIQIYYYCVSSGSGKCLLQVAYIEPSEKGDIKNGFIAGMSEQTIENFCGTPSRKNEHKTNYELCYDSPSFHFPGQVNFSFDNKTEKLTGIILWYGID